VREIQVFPKPGANRVVSYGAFTEEKTLHSKAQSTDSMISVKAWRQRNGWG